MLPGKIKKLENRNIAVNVFLNSLRYLLIKTFTLFDDVVVQFNKNIYHQKKFKKMQNYKKKYNGERCFIVCTGPSLTIKDLELLKDEYSFGMNSICLSFSKTNWRPSFFGIQDLCVYKKLEKVLLEQIKCPMFISDTIRKKCNILQEWVVFNLNSNYHAYELLFQKKYFSKFSNDCSIVVYDGYSITYSLIQLAVYMGFKQIYLIGADSDYNGKKQHFIEHGHYDPNSQSAGDRLTVAYNIAMEHCNKHGVEIYNATRGGMLEVFPRVDLDEVLKMNDNK